MLIATVFEYVIAVNVIVGSTRATKTLSSGLLDYKLNIIASALVANSDSVITLDPEVFSVVNATRLSLVLDSPVSIVVESASPKY